MNMRPCFQFRLRSFDQEDVLRKLARRAGLSVNEYVLQALEEKLAKEPHEAD